MTEVAGLVDRIKSLVAEQQERDGSRRAPPKAREIDCLRLRLAYVLRAKSRRLRRLSVAIGFRPSRSNRAAGAGAANLEAL
jgi:hypothetical protein